MSPLTRRHFLQASSLAAASAVLPVRGLDAQAYRAHPAAALDSRCTSAPELNAIVDAALDAAKRAGAAYADVHVGLTEREEWGQLWDVTLPQSPHYAVHASLGVRALVNGYWGYAAADGVGTVDVATRLGRDATTQARTAATGKPRVVEMAETPVVTGNWVMPVQVDPFTVSYEEKYDTIAAMNEYAIEQRNAHQSTATVVPPYHPSFDVSFHRESRTFASSDGSFVTQTLYRTVCDFRIRVVADWLTEQGADRFTGVMSLAGAGWEYVLSAPYRDDVPRMIEEALRARRPRGVDVGRYDLVLDAAAMATILNRTIGTATAADRAMGDRPDGDTSYITDPLAMLGTLRTGSPLLTVTANRSMPGGAATVKWDDEGVEPQSTTLVANGVLTDLQTTRESASWLAPYYRRVGKTIQSNGCAGVLGTEPVSMRSPNLVMQPGTKEVTFEEMVKSTSKGLAILGGEVRSDYQALNGYGTGALVFEINNGQLGRAVMNASYLYRTPEFWKNLEVVGGAATARTFGFEQWNDTSAWGLEDRTANSVCAVPGKITGVAVVDAMRRA